MTENFGLYFQSTQKALLPQCLNKSHVVTRSYDIFIIEKTRKGLRAIRLHGSHLGRDTGGSNLQIVSSTIQKDCDRSRSISSTIVAFPQRGRGSTCTATHGAGGFTKT